MLRSRLKCPPPYDPLSPIEDIINWKSLPGKWQLMSTACKWGKHLINAKWSNYAHTPPPKRQVLAQQTDLSDSFYHIYLSIYGCCVSRLKQLKVSFKSCSNKTFTLLSLVIIISLNPSKFYIWIREINEYCSRSTFTQWIRLCIHISLAWLTLRMSVFA